MTLSMHFATAAPSDNQISVSMVGSTILCAPTGEAICRPSPGSDRPHLILFTSRDAAIRCHASFAEATLDPDILPHLERAARQDLGVLVDPYVDRTGAFVFRTLLSAHLDLLSTGGSA